MIDFEYKQSYGVQDLVEIVRLLRAPGGCPWDREQTHESIRRNFLEEAYEVAEAIDEDSPTHLCEELGDVLLQVVFHARIEQEQGRFDLDAVADGICKKLIYRHPHVFDQTEVSGAGEVLQNWEVLKRTEKGQATHTDTLNAVARSLPALWRAEKVQRKAASAGLTPRSQAGPVTEEQIGSALFAAVNAARQAGIDPEAALNRATDHFISRFSELEQTAGLSGQDFSSLGQHEVDRLWE